METATRKPQKRAGGERRGNSKDRAARRAFLLRYWGNGETCQCVWCGTLLRDVPATEQAHGFAHPEHIQADKIIPHLNGPGYVRSNIVPACGECNGRRNDTDFAMFATLMGVDGETIRTYASLAPKRG